MEKRSNQKILAQDKRSPKMTRQRYVTAEDPAASGHVADSAGKVFHRHFCIAKNQIKGTKMKAYRPYRMYNQTDENLLVDAYRQNLIGCSQRDRQEAAEIFHNTFGRNASGNNPQEEIK